MNTQSDARAEPDVEGLWKFQLRKENKALVGEIEAMKRRYEEVEISNQCRLRNVTEELAMLREKVVRLQESETQYRELCAVRADLAFPKASQQRPSDKRFSDGTPKERPEQEHATAAPAHKPALKPVLQPSSKISKITVVSKSDSILNVLDELVLPSNETDAHVSPTARPKNTVPPVIPRTTRSTAQKSQFGSKDLPLIPQTNMRLPKLIQTTMSLDDYMAKASAIHMNFPKNIEIPFVAHFLKGLTSDGTKSKILSNLSANKLSRVRKDGTLDILCNWAKFEKFMLNVGMVEGRSEASEAPKKKRTGAKRL